PHATENPVPISPPSRRSARAAAATAALVLLALAPIAAAQPHSGAAAKSAADSKDAPRSEIAHFTLANGLEVVVVPGRRAPVVTHMVWYKVGAADETPGKSGLA